VRQSVFLCLEVEQYSQMRVSGYASQHYLIIQSYSQDGANGTRTDISRWGRVPINFFLELQLQKRHEGLTVS